MEWRLDRAGWLSAKLLLVIAINGLHGVQSIALGRLALGTGKPHRCQIPATKTSKSSTLSRQLLEAPDS
jgi:uncharacterized membrane protein